LKELKLDVFSIEKVKTMKNGTATENGDHIMTFEKNPLPENIIIGYMRYKK
jgi:hypothetical protein